MEVYNTIQKDAKKAPGYDLITGKILKELPDKALRLITIIYNAVLRLNYYPAQWKTAQVILLPKPGKNLEEVTSYRPISLLPVISACNCLLPVISFLVNRSRNSTCNSD